MFETAPAFLMRDVAKQSLDKPYILIDLEFYNVTTLLCSLQMEHYRPKKSHDAF